MKQQISWTSKTQQNSNCTPACLSVRSMHKSDHRESDSWLGETRKLLYQPELPAGGKGGEKMGRDSPNTLLERAEKPVAELRHQNRKQRSGNSKETTVDYYQPWLQKGKAEPQSPSPNPEGLSWHILWDWTPQGALGESANATKTVPKIDRDWNWGDWVWLSIRKKRHY